MEEPRFTPRKFDFGVHYLKFTIITARIMQNESIALTSLSFSLPVHKVAFITPPAHRGVTRIQERESVEVQTHIFRMDKQQGPTISHRELYPISMISHNGKNIRMCMYVCTHTCVCITESLCWTAEINTAL